MFKKVLILLIIVIVLVVGGLVWFITTVDLNRYIPQIERLAKEQAKQEVSIGNLAFSFKGGLSVEVREVAWRPIEVEGLSGTLDAFYLQLRFLPLLTGKLEISRIELVRPDIVFYIAPEAIQPIEATQEPVKEVVEAPPEVVVSPSQADRSRLPSLPVDTSSEGKVNALLPRLNLDSFFIKEGKFTYQNETDPRIQGLQFEKINLRASHISLHESFDVEGSLLLDANPIALKGRGGPLAPAGAAGLKAFNEIPVRLEVSADNLVFHLIQKFAPEILQDPWKLQMTGPETLLFIAEGTLNDLKVKYVQIATQQKLEFAQAFIKKADRDFEISLDARLLDVLNQTTLQLERGSVLFDQLTLKGSGEISLKENRVQHFGFQISDYPLHNLKEIFPQAAPLNLAGKLTANLDLKDYDLGKSEAASEALKTALKGSLSLQQLQIQPDLFILPIQSAILYFTLENGNLTWAPALFELGSGQISLRGHVDDVLQQPRAQVNIKINEIPLEDTIDLPVEKDISLKGLLSGEGDITSLPQAEKDVIDSLNGNFHFAIQEGAIQNLNIIDEVMEQASRVPGLSGSLRSVLEKKFPRLAASPHTEFEKAEVQGEIRDGRVIFSNVRLSSTEFDLLGYGTYELTHQVLAFSGKLVFSGEATASLLHSIRELGYLVDQSGRLVFNFTVTGREGKIKVSLLKEFLQDAIQNFLLKQGSDVLLRKVLKVEPSTTTTPSTVPGPTQSEKPVESVDELIQYGLSKIFGIETQE